MAPKLRTSGLFALIMLATCACAYAQNVTYGGPKSLVQGQPVNLTSTGGQLYVGFSPPAVQYAGFKDLKGIAADHLGNIYVAEWGTNSVKKINTGGGAITILGSGFKQPAGVAVDSAGNVYVADFGNSAIKKIPAGGGAVVTMATVTNVQFIAADAAGNVYFANPANGSYQEIPANGGSRITIGSGYANLAAIAVDAYGNLYIGTPGGPVTKLPAGGGQSVNATPNSTFNVTGLAADPSGNIYVIQQPSGSTIPLHLVTTNGDDYNYGQANSFNAPRGIAADGSGNLYVTEYGTVKKSKAYSGYFIANALPKGLLFSSRYAYITGTPVAPNAATDYHVNYYVNSSHYSTTLNLTINAAGKPILSYSGSPQADTVNITIKPLTPSNGTTPANSYAISPTLPAGLFFNTSNGVIGGTPTASSPATDYTVTGTNSYGNGTTTVNIGVVPLLKPNISYPSPQVYTVGTVIVAMAPVNSGGKTFSYSVSPALPQGLSLNVNTGIITGAPIAAAPAANYTVTAGNPTGISSFTISILVNPAVAAPAISYSTLPAPFVAGTAITPLSPVNTGGAVLGYSISPALPQGLSFDTHSGVISGTPVAASPKASYTISAYNKAGGSPAIINLSVRSQTAPNISYAAGIHVYSIGLPITPEIPVNTGDASGNWSVSPALPAGISLDPATGTLSGTPSAASAAADYTVTATNTAGSGQAVINIRVISPSAPSISYSSPQVYGVGTTIQPLTPVNSGSAVPSQIPVTLASGIAAFAIAVDGADNVYVASAGIVQKIPAGGGDPLTIGSGFYNPRGIAVDGSGNVYVADTNNGQIKEIPAGGGSIITIASGLNYPYRIALDASANIYFTEEQGSNVKKIPAGGGAPVTIGAGINQPGGITLDAAGNVYVYDSYNRVTKKILATDGSVVIFGNFGGSNGIALDAAGNFYFNNGEPNEVFEVPAGTNFFIPIGSGFNYPWDIAADAAGNLFVADGRNNAVKEIYCGGYFLDPGLPLPGGLQLDPNTGIISGTPNSIIQANDYTVFARNRYGTSSATINIQVTASPAPQISYSSPQTYFVGAPITPLMPQNTGGVINHTFDVTDGPYTAYTGMAVNDFGTMYTTTQSITGVAIDDNRNGYTTSPGSNAVTKFPAAGGASVTVGKGFITPRGLAADAAGNLYVVDAGSKSIKKVLAGGDSTITIVSGLNNPYGIAIAPDGTIYITDGGLKKILPGSTSPIPILTSAGSTRGLAADGRGNVYYLYGTELFQTDKNGAPPTLLYASLHNMAGVGVDNMGTLYALASGYVLDEQGDGYEDPSQSIVSLYGGYTVSPALPAGLFFNTANGSISGIPASVSPATNYTITGFNYSGISATTLTLGVSLPPKVDITYPGPQVYTAQTIITPLIPKNNGGLPVPPQAVYYGGGVNYTCLTIDRRDRLFAFDSRYNTIDIFSAGAAAGNVNATEATSVAVDATGNIFFTEQGWLEEIPAGGGAQIALKNELGAVTGMAIDANGNFYLAAGANVKKLSADLATLTYLPIPLTHAAAVALDAAGNVYVADDGASKIVQYSEAAGKSTILGYGFNHPTGVAVDGDGNVYVADYNNNQVKKIAAGNGAVTVLASLQSPHGIAVDGLKKVYINYDKKFIEEIHSGGFSITPALPAGLTFNNSTGIISGTPAAASPAQNYLVAAYNYGGIDSTYVNISVNPYQAPAVSYAGPQQYTKGTTIQPLAPTSAAVAPFGYSAFPASLAGGFTDMRGIAADAAGNIYVADNGSNAIDKIPPGGGTAVAIGSGFNHPTGVAADGHGNIFVADAGNNMVKEIPADGGAIITRGSGFNTPYGVAVDAAGNVYVSDSGNNAIKEIAAGSAVVTTLAAGFNVPTGIAVDAAGNVFVADRGNNAVKKILAGGMVTTVAAGLNAPNGVAVDNAGNIYIDDAGNNAIELLPGGSGAPISLGSFNSPTGLGIDGAGNLYISENGTFTAKQLKPAGGYFISPGLPAGLVFDNNTGVISGTPTAISPATDYKISACSNTGSASATVNIKVTQPGAPNISYSSPQNYPLNQPIASLSPANSGGAVTAGGYSVHPLLPQGLTLNTSTGVISGTPTAISPAADYTVTAANASGTGAATITIRVYPSSATLSNLTPGAGTLSPSFSAVNTSYSLAEAYSTSSITITPTATVASSVIQVNGATVASGSASASIFLNLGANIITTTVTAADGSTLAYTINANRASSSNADLAGITMSSGVLSPAFSPGVNNYTSAVANSVTSVTVTPALSDANASVAVNGRNVASGSASAPIQLAAGPNTINITVTAQDGTVKSTIITENRIPPSGTDLASLSLVIGGHAVSYTPAFSANVTSYSATTGAGSKSANVYFDEVDHTSTIKVNGSPAASPVTVALVAGHNPVNITITAQNGTTSKTYTLDIAVVSTNANLSHFTISAGTLSPAFATNTRSYTAREASTITSITVTPTAASATATIKVNGVSVASGSASQSIPLSVGSNTINTVVTAANTAFSNTYTLVVNRAGSSNAKLSALAISSGILSPAFSTNTTSYTATVGGGVSSMIVTPTVTQANATIKVNGTTVASGSASPPIPLAVGANTITTVVTAENGTTTDTYTITVTRPASSNASLAGLSLSAGTLNPAFAADTYSYTTSEANTITSIKVTPTAADPAATIKVNGTAVASGAASASIPLTVGHNTINVTVTGHDGVTTNTYTIVATRAGSSNAKLSNLAISTGSLTPAFNPNTTGYTASVFNSTTSVTVTPTRSEPHATIKVNGNTVASGSPSASIALHVGSNTITTIVTAQNGTTTSTYTITVTRPTTNNTNLSNLTITSGAISPAFDGSNQPYTDTVSSSTTSVKVTPTSANPLSTITVNGSSVATGAASQSIAISSGNNPVTIVVTSQDGTATKTYTLTVSKTSNNAKLSALKLNTGSISPAFDPATSSYTETVANSVAAVRVTATSQEAAETIEVNGMMVTSGSPSGAISLAVGTNTITTLVTAQDGATTQTYTITVTRAVQSVNTLYEPVGVEKPTETPRLNDEVMVHQAVSPNGDGQNDVLTIDNIAAYPENSLKIMNRSGELIYDVKGYDNSTRFFDGHSNKNGQLQKPGTYFYSLEYSVKGVLKRKTGFIVLKY